MINRASLSQTLDAVSEVAFDQRKLPPGERTLIAQWIAARQRLPGAYADTFAGFPGERTNGIVVFTGERITKGNGYARAWVSSFEHIARATKVGGSFPSGIPSSH